MKWGLFLRSSLLTLVTTSIVSCGGGGSSSATQTPTPQPTNSIPQVSLTPITVNEKAQTSLTASVTSDETITNYSWQISTNDISLENANTATVSFVAPEVNQITNYNISLTVTDASGDQVTASTQVTVNQLTIPLTIKGFATDAPLANATVQAYLQGDSQPIATTTTDQLGKYTLSLTLDDSSLTSMLYLTAQGSGSQENASLISYLGSVEKLANLAGYDEELTLNEFFGINITNFTTAEYAFLKKENPNFPTTEQTLLQARKRLEYLNVFSLATAIKVAIDKSIDNPSLALPSGIDNTFELINDEVQMLNYIKQVRGSQEYQDATQEIYQDNNIFDYTSTYLVPETYSFMITPFTTGISFTFDNQSKTGKSYSEYHNDVNAYHWDVENGTLHIDYDDKLGITGNFYGAYTTVTDTVNISLKRLASLEDSDVLLMDYQCTRHYGLINGEFPPDSDCSYKTTVIAYKSKTYQPIAVNTPSYLYISIDETRTNDLDGEIVATKATKFKLNTDGTGVSFFENDMVPFTWSTDSNNLLNLKYNAYKIGNLTDRSEQTQFRVYRHEIDEDHIGYGSLVEESKQPKWTTANVPGIYSYQDDELASRISYFWFELHSNGDAETISVYDYDENGEIAPDEIVTMYGNWKIDNDNVVIQRVRKASDNSWTPDCRYVSEQCALYHERTWELISEKENAYQVYHKHDWASVNILDELAIKTFIKSEVAPFNVNSVLQNKPFDVNLNTNKLPNALLRK